MEIVYMIMPLMMGTKIRLNIFVAYFEKYLAIFLLIYLYSFVVLIFA